MVLLDFVRAFLGGKQVRNKPMIQGLVTDVTYLPELEFERDSHMHKEIFK